MGQRVIAFCRSSSVIPALRNKSNAMIQTRRVIHLFGTTTNRAVLHQPLVKLASCERGVNICLLALFSSTTWGREYRSGSLSNHHYESWSQGTFSCVISRTVILTNYIIASVLGCESRWVALRWNESNLIVLSLELKGLEGPKIYTSWEGGVCTLSNFRVPFKLNSYNRRNQM